MVKHRRQYAAQEKMLVLDSDRGSILRRHLVDGLPVSDLCDEPGLQTTRRGGLSEPPSDRGL